ncbi:MAG: DNA polymerase III subunit gamma/tau [Pseudomonadota bacterium]
MSYQVLARKWRPKTFSELVGQPHVVRALTNALESKRLHHAYLFTGTRGVGKTTISRILAKSLNCEVGISATPCGQCSSCKDVDAGKFVDLIEIDAASRTKVEDTREILDNVQYRPSRGRYKVYLIDEVHMLSNSSFNALLKTLEEPPPHVVFFLATTDPQKIPPTVLSRCLQFNLKSLTPELIANQLDNVLQQEAIDYDQKALKRIAVAAEGSMRDGLSLLDQAIAYGGNRVVIDDVLEMLGTVDGKFVINLLTAVHHNNPKDLIVYIQSIKESSINFKNLLNEVIDAFHHIAIFQSTQINTSELLEHDQVQGFAQKLSPQDIQLFYQIGLHGRRDFELYPQAAQALEMTLLRMLAFRPQRSASQQASFHDEKTLPDSAPIAPRNNPAQHNNEKPRVVKNENTSNKNNNAFLESKSANNSVSESVAPLSFAKEVPESEHQSKPQIPEENEPPTKPENLESSSVNNLIDDFFNLLPDDADVSTKNKVVTTSAKVEMPEKRDAETLPPIEKKNAERENCLTEKVEHVKTIQASVTTKPQKPVSFTSEKASNIKADDSYDNKWWCETASQLALNGPAQQVALHAALSAFDGQAISLQLDDSVAPLASKERIEKITAAVEAFIGKPLKLQILEQTLNKNDKETPQAMLVRQEKERKAEALTSIVQDIHVMALQEQFNASIDEQSIKPR